MVKKQDLEAARNNRHDLARLEELGRKVFTYGGLGAVCQLFAFAGLGVPPQLLAELIGRRQRRNASRRRRKKAPARPGWHRQVREQARKVALVWTHWEDFH